MIIADIEMLRKKYFLYDTVSAAIWTINMNLNPNDQIQLFRKLSNPPITDLFNAKKTFGRWMVQARSKKEKILIVIDGPKRIKSIESELGSNGVQRPEHQYTFSATVKKKKIRKIIFF